MHFFSILGIFRRVDDSDVCPVIFVFVWLRERQISYDNTYMRDLKNDTKKLNYTTEIAS